MRADEIKHVLADFDLADRVLELRDERGWRQVDLAKQAHLGIGTIRDLEADRRPVLVSTVRRLARAFGLSTEEFLQIPERDRGCGRKL